MAHDDRYGSDGDRRPRQQDRRPGPRPERLGDRNFRGERDDPEYGAERYGAGAVRGYGSGPNSSDPNSFFGAPGYDAEFAGPRFDRLDVGSTGTHGVHPVSSAFGADYRGAVGVTSGGGFGSSARLHAQMEQQQRHQQGTNRQHGGSSQTHDPHYAEWRNRQIEQLDRDYEDYRRENQSRFESEFGSWRERRAGQRKAVEQVSEHMDVVGSDGSPVGTVDCTRGDRIILAKKDPQAGGHHHSIPCAWIDSVDDKVTLNVSAEEATRRWRDEERSRALFEREDSGTDGPHMLNRSFAGTYRSGGDD